MVQCILEHGSKTTNTGMEFIVSVVVTPQEMFTKENFTKTNRLATEFTSMLLDMSTLVIGRKIGKKVLED